MNSEMLSVVAIDKILTRKIIYHHLVFTFRTESIAFNEVVILRLV